jgi:hypothetical protein
MKSLQNRSLSPFINGNQEKPAQNRQNHPTYFNISPNKPKSSKSPAQLSNRYKESTYTNYLKNFDEKYIKNLIDIRGEYHKQMNKKR